MEDDDMQDTFNESMAKSVRTFCDDLNPLSNRDKPFYNLCNELKKLRVDPNDIVQNLYNNRYIQFLNPKYVASAIIYDDSNIVEYCKNLDLDIADFIRYLVIKREYLE